MNELTTLRETLAEDEKVTSFSATTLRAVKTWLRRHGITDCVPLEVEAVGMVHTECGEAVIGTAESGQHITGRTVAVLLEVK